MELVIGAIIISNKILIDEEIPSRTLYHQQFESITEALEFAMKTYQASETEFVTAGMIQEEYLDYLRSK